MKLPAWCISAAVGSAALGAIVGGRVVVALGLAGVARWFPGWGVADRFAARVGAESWLATVGAVGAAMVAGGLAGAVHGLARRWIGRKPVGPLAYGVVVAEAYLFALRCFFVFDASSNARRPWGDVPVVAAFGLVVGLVWGVLSWHDESTGA